MCFCPWIWALTLVSPYDGGGLCDLPPCAPMPHPLGSNADACLLVNGCSQCHSPACAYRGGNFALKFFRTRKFRTEFISHSGLKIPREISHPSRIVLFTSGSCTAKFQRVPGLFCVFPRASTWAFFIFRGFLRDLDLNPMPQTHLPFGCCAATNRWTKIFTP